MASKPHSGHYFGGPFTWEDIASGSRMEFVSTDELTSFLNWKSGRLEEQLEAQRAETDKAWEFEHKMMERATKAEEQFEAKQKALAAALDVAIWLSALIGNPDGAADPQAAETWENEMRPKLFAALHESNPAPDCDQSSTCRAETHKPWCFAESNPVSGPKEGE